jgi:hypothetical protein
MTTLTAASQFTDDCDTATATGSIDRVIRISTAVAVAGVAAYVSYWHAYAVVRAHGETGVTARLEPATIDGPVYASSMVVLYAARHRLPVPSLARWLLGLGIAASLTANMAQGWSHGPVGAAVAAWPAISLVGSYELLVWLVRTAGALEPGPAEQHVSDSTADCARACRLSTPAIGGQWRNQDEREIPGQARQEMGPPAARPPMPSNAKCAEEVHEVDPVNGEAVAAYQLSMRAGNPLSERKLAQMFGRTSRRWARARIAEAAAGCRSVRTLLRDGPDMGTT